MANSSSLKRLFVLSVLANASALIIELYPGSLLAPFSQVFLSPADTAMKDLVNVHNPFSVLAAIVVNIVIWWVAFLLILSFIKHFAVSEKSPPTITGLSHPDDGHAEPKDNPGRPTTKTR